MKAIVVTKSSTTVLTTTGGVVRVSVGNHLPKVELALKGQALTHYLDPEDAFQIGEALMQAARIAGVEVKREERLRKALKETE